jgi:hypothetical protein
MSYTSVFGGTTIYPSDVSYLPLALAADTTLEWPLEASGDVTVAARIIGVTPASAGRSVIMPDATRTGTGQSVLFNNMSGTRSFFVKDDGGSTLATVAPGTQWQIYLTDNTTAAGTWEVYQMGASTATVQASALAGPGLTVYGSQLAQAAPFSNFTSNLAPKLANRAAMYVYTGTGAATVTLPVASSVGDTYFLRIRNQGGGVLLIDPQGTDLINGVTSLNLAPEDSAMFITDGATKWYTVGLGQNAAFTFDYVSISVAPGGATTLAGAQLNRIAYRFTGALNSNAVIIVPQTVQQYWVNNQTTGNFTLGVKTASQVIPVLVNQDASAILYCDGQDVVLADTSTISVPVAVSQGGTGASTASGARANLGITPYADPLVTAANSPAAQAVLFPSPITDGQILIGNAATPGFAQTTLTAGTGIGILNGPGAVTITNTGSPAPGSVYSQLFSGTGAQTAFTLSYQPFSEDNTQVYINGVYQQKNTYSLSGFTITFNTAPPLGTSNIEVVVIQVVPIGATTANLVAIAQGGTVQDAISYTTPAMYGVVADGVTNNYAALVAMNAALAAAGGGVAYFPSGVIAWSGVITVPTNVIWLGSGCSSQDQAGTTFKALSSTFQLAFGGRGTGNKYNGSSGGGFNVDGNNVAPAPLYMGRCLQIDWRNIVVKNGAAGGQAWLIEEAQNCSFNNCNISSGAGDGLVLDCGAGGHAFYRCEFNGAAGPGIVVRETTGTGPYPYPTHLKFDHCIIERQTGGCAVRIGQTAVVTSVGYDITFNQCIFAIESSTVVAGNLIDIQRGVRIRFFAPQFSGAIGYTTGLFVANGSSVYSRGIIRGLNLLNFFNIDASANFDYDQYVVVGSSVTNVWTGTGAQNTYARNQLMSPLQVTRLTTADTFLLNYIAGETQPRSRMNGDGSIAFSDGTVAPDTSIFRSGTRRVGTNGSFIPSYGLILNALTAAPTGADLSTGLIVRADGVTWNPLGTGGGVSYMVWYTGSTWRGLNEDANGNNLP